MNEFSIKPELITKEMMEQFVAYLQSRSVGEGAKSIYQRFKKVIRYAIDHDVMLKDPSKSVTCKVDSDHFGCSYSKNYRIPLFSLINHQLSLLRNGVYTCGILHSVRHPYP